MRRCHPLHLGFCAAGTRRAVSSFACIFDKADDTVMARTGKEDEHRRDRHAAELIEASRQAIERLHGLVQERLLLAIRASQGK